MPSIIVTMRRDVLKDTVILHNSLGEIEDEIAYQDTILSFCYCPSSNGMELTNQGNKSNCSAKLYLFDDKTEARSVNGSIRKYLPYEEWLNVTDKSKYWTLSEKGDDFLTIKGLTRRLRIFKFSHKKAGSRRMWHFEVEAK